MKPKLSVALFALLLFACSSALAQQGDPPPAAAEYSPKSWKEYTYEDDHLRFRFPIEPIKEETVTGAVKAPTHKFKNGASSFLYLRLDVISWPSDSGLDGKLMVKAMEEGILAGMKSVEPKVIKNEETNIDGNPGKFIHVETNDGRVVRYKIFFAGTRSYAATVVVGKGKRHGFNWENDFEVPAMAFLDSIHVSLPSK